MTFNPVRISANNPGPMTGDGNNTYLLVEPDSEGALIDAGVGEPGHIAAVDRQLEARGARLTRVLVTHAHADHAAGAPALARAYKGVRFHKFPWPEEDSRFDVEWTPIAGGETLMAGGAPLVAIHTAGHSPDHLVFWHEPSRTAFTGDLVVQGSSVMIHSSGGGDLTTYLDALERLVSLRPRRLLPAHGPEVTDPVGVLTAYLDHRRLRERQVIAALSAGRDTVQAIAESIYDGLDPALVPAALENVRAHLEKLRQEGRAVDENARWTMKRAC